MKASIAPSSQLSEWPKHFISQGPPPARPDWEPPVLSPRFNPHRHGMQYRTVDIIDDATSDKSEDEEPGSNHGVLDREFLLAPHGTPECISIALPATLPQTVCVATLMHGRRRINPFSDGFSTIDPTSERGS